MLEDTFKKKKNRAWVREIGFYCAVSRVLLFSHAQSSGLNPKPHIDGVWWHTPEIPALGR